MAEEAWEAWADCLEECLAEDFRVGFCSAIILNEHIQYVKGLIDLLKNNFIHRRELMFRMINLTSKWSRL